MLAQVRFSCQGSPFPADTWNQSNGSTFEGQLTDQKQAKAMIYSINNNKKKQRRHLFLLTWWTLSCQLSIVQWASPKACRQNLGLPALASACRGICTPEQRILHQISFCNVSPCLLYVTFARGKRAFLYVSLSPDIRQTQWNCTKYCHTYGNVIVDCQAYTRLHVHTILYIFTYGNVIIDGQRIFLFLQAQPGHATKLCHLLKIVTSSDRPLPSQHTM